MRKSGFFRYAHFVVQIVGIAAVAVFIALQGQHNARPLVCFNATHETMLQWPDFHYHHIHRIAQPLHFCSALDDLRLELLHHTHIFAADTQEINVAFHNPRQIQLYGHPPIVEVFDGSNWRLFSDFASRLDTLFAMPTDVVIHYRVSLVRWYGSDEKLPPGLYRVRIMPVALHGNTTGGCDCAGRICVVVTFVVGK